MIQRANPGPYNIGQQARVIGAVLRTHCNMPPYLRLVASQRDENGFVTVKAVNTETEQADISNCRFLGAVWVPLEALLF